MSYAWKRAVETSLKDIAETQADILGVLRSLLTLQTQLHQGQTDMTAELTRLTAEVAQTRSAIDSAVTLIAGLAQQIRDNATDPAALSALADSLDAGQADIAAAVTANTPADTNPPAETTSGTEPGLGGAIDIGGAVAGADSGIND